MNPIFIPILVVAIFAIVIGTIVKITKKSTDSSEDDSGKKTEYEYVRKQYIMSIPEHELFDVLVKILGETYNIFPQVQISSLVYAKGYDKVQYGARKNTTQKTVDFVICDKTLIQPLLVIELDDDSHARPDRRARDESKEKILASAGLPLLRYRKYVVFDPEDVKSKVLAKILSAQS
jgi:very-short-patch-repair endonuclease